MPGSDTETPTSQDATSTEDSATEPSVTEPVTQPNTDCVIEVNAELSEQIATVGIVTFTTDLGAVDGGYVEFGPDEQYGQRAPLNVDATDYRTLMLGMRQSTEYHYRVVATSGGSVCTSGDAVFTTGSAPEGVPTPMVTVTSASDVTPGYVVTSNQRYIVIYDHTGELVWWYQTPIMMVTSARMAWDGQAIFARDGNPGGTGAGSVVRVTMDGLSQESVSVPLGHHDSSPSPDNGMLFLTGGGTDGCGMVRKLSAAGELTDVYDVRQAFAGAAMSGNDPCHCNSIHYNSADQSITFSCLNQNAYVKISEGGDLIWVLGGDDGQSTFSGDVTWSRQHGHHMIDPTHIVFFNNNGSGMGGGGMGGGSSLAVEIELDLDAMTATRIWEYDGNDSSQTLGDVQRLPTGNTFVTYCNSGGLHEVKTDETLVQTWAFSGGVGYASHRESLYGPPPEL